MYDDDDSESTSYYYPKCRAYHSDRDVLYSTQNSQMIYIPSSSAWTSAPLPHDKEHWNSFSRSGMVEYKSMYYLTCKRIINWCPSLSTLYPLFTAGKFCSHAFLACCTLSSLMFPENILLLSIILFVSSVSWCGSRDLCVGWCRVLGDGNCLMNAVSLYVWARQDIGVKLRQTVYRNLANCAIRSALRERWQSEREWQNANIPDGGLYYTDEVCVCCFNVNRLSWVFVASNWSSWVADWVGE